MLRDRLQAALKEAMKAREAETVSTLRLILAALKDRDVAARGKGEPSPVGDDEIVGLLAKMVRQRREAIKQFEAGGRLDLAERERAEIAVIERFMPKQMTDQEIAAAVDAVIAELGAAEPKDLGRTIAALKARYAGRIDLAKASARVREALR